MRGPFAVRRDVGTGHGLQEAAWCGGDAGSVRCRTFAQKGIVSYKATRRAPMAAARRAP